MNKFMKAVSTLLAVLMLLSTLSCLFVVDVSAADTKKEEKEEKTVSTINYVTEVFEKPDDVLEWMEPMMENDNYVMYFNTYTGAFAVQNKVTGQLELSNPYDVASSAGSESTKQTILSQVLVKYVDNDQTKELNSYKDAALNGQITVKRIKGAIRVEYVIGNEATRKLVPRWISVTNFQELILAPLELAIGGTHNYERFCAMYALQDLSKATAAKTREAILKKYPICEEFPIYTLDTTVTTVEMNFIEEHIKGYCPDYTFDQMEADHTECGYEGDNDLSPVFKLALEYSLNNDGFTVREPNNGLRYNTTLYSLEKLTILPYMGAGNSYNTGYTMYPDGSFALFNFEDLKGKQTFTASRKVYSTDYAYHTLDGTYQKAIRLPVFGVKSDNSYLYYTTTKVEENAETGVEEEIVTEHKVSVTVDHRTVKEVEEELEKLVDEEEIDDYSDVEIVTDSVGYIAVIEEGESLCELATYHAGSLSDYHTIMTYFNPRPKDSYDLSDAISVTASSTLTVVSDRKYTGNLKIRYIMLADEGLATETEFAANDSFYRADYVGAAKAYTSYLEQQSVLTRLTEEDVYDDMPLYIESFGCLDVVEQVLSFPVTISKPLTTFDDVWTMYDELSKAGATNINFRLTGYANGGMYATVPYRLKWEKSVGGSDGLEELLLKAKQVLEDGEGQLGLYPEFEFLYRKASESFDGFKAKRDAIRTIDDRYANRRYYSATQQKYINAFEMALSPAYIDRFYNKMLSKYADYLEIGPLGISVGSLGTDLNSDFDEDEPYNREDDKAFLAEALKEISGTENLIGVMANGGNAYTLKYIDHLLNVSLDSSRFMKASASIPFVGMVLHGYIQFAGTALNTEGDTNYAMLKAIENGASLYFKLSYRNTSYLKEDYFLSENYSVNYAIWKDDVIKYYNELNSVMSDLQTKLIIDHRFVVGTRILDLDEIEANIRDTMEGNVAYEKAYEEYARLEKVKSIAAARAAARSAVDTMEQTVEDLTEQLKMLSTLEKTITKDCKTCDTKKAQYDKAIAESGEKLEKLKADYDVKKKQYDDLLAQQEALEANPDGLDESALLKKKTDMKKSVAAAKKLSDEAYTAYNRVNINIKAYLKSYNSALNDVKNDAVSGIQAAVDAVYAYENVVAMYETAEKAVELLLADGAAQEVIDDAEKGVMEAVGYLDTIAELAEKCNSYIDSIYTAAATHVSKEKIDDEVDFHEDEEEEEEETEEDSIYVSDNGNIVAVTYGGKNGNDNEAYKTFILNYNNYAVTVDWEVGEETRVYTIPAGKYVVIQY